MTAMHRPEPEPAGELRLLTIAEYAELGETEHGYTELIEGRLLTLPSPAPNHNIAMGELFVQLRSTVPEHLQVVQDIDVDLELAAEDAPGFSRRPDLIVVGRGAVERIRQDGGLFRASDVVLVIEIVSPSSWRVDHIDKRRDYADAGIRYYWVVDIDRPVALTAYHFTEEFGYREDQIATGKFSTESPFPFVLDLDQLG